MKGSPLREFLFLMILAAGLILPLMGLSRRPAPVPRAVTADPAQERDIEVWLEVRFSHPPVSAALWQGDTLRWEGGEETRGDADIELSVHRLESTLRLEAEWEDGVENPYVELRLEPTDLQAHTLGEWGRSGRLDRTWRISWEEVP
jgi:hypothetical protein